LKQIKSEKRINDLQTQAKESITKSENKKLNPKIVEKIYDIILFLTDIAYSLSMLLLSAATTIVSVKCGLSGNGNYLYMYKYI
jgi:hypothetical protein